MVLNESQLGSPEYEKFWRPLLYCSRHLGKKADNKIKRADKTEEDTDNL